MYIENKLVNESLYFRECDERISEIKISKSVPGTENWF